jgi:pimeloyl-ACP methyl ester carboxylesterase
MTRRPELRYAMSGDVYIAYQVFGDGPIDLVLVTEWMTPLDARWDVPLCSSALERLGKFARVISFDKRGIGCSDPVPIELGSTPEAWMDDIRVVMDAVSSERAAIMGAHDGGPIAMLFAATYPDRTSHLILANTGARRRRAPDYHWGLPDELIDRVGWQSPGTYARNFPENWLPDFFADRRMDDWADRARRTQASPTVMAPSFG